MIGQLVDGKYRIESVLGQGGMGTVYQATHTGTGRRVAVKFIASEEMISPEIVSRFQREARAAGAIDTQHIVQVFDTGTDATSRAPFIVMEYLTGRDLSDVLAQNGRLSLDVALRVVMQACLGLAKAHEAGVVHRDIKPPNIFLASRDKGEVVVKLLDFGVAKVKADAAAMGSSNIALTNPGGLVGSPPYMSPEQARGLSTIDHRTDVWSLGVVLYEALAGVSPFVRDSIPKTILAVATQDPQPIQELVPDAPPEVVAVVQRSLQRDPKRRYQTVNEMSDAIEPLLPNGWSIHQRMIDPRYSSEVPRGDESDTGDRKRKSSPTPRAAEKSTSDSAKYRVTPPGQGGSADTLGLSSTQNWMDMMRDGTPGEAGDPLLDTTIDGRYKLVKLLGTGGMGAVYEAVDPDGKHCALKIILPDVALKSTDALRRFVLEARAGMKLRNDYIAQMLEAGSDEQRRLPFIVMELLQGIDVGRYVDQHGPMTPSIAARLFKEACLGLASAHDLGMIHRDIKPENIFLHEMEDGTIIPKICDFGIAKQDTNLEELRATALTQTGSMLGSPMYMSPEQAENPKRADARSDIWSMGISLYEALCGHPAWEGCSTVGELLLKLYTKEVTPIQDIAPWIAPELADVVHKALRRDPAARYQTASEFAQALAPLATTESVKKTTSIAIPRAGMDVVAPRVTRSETTSISVATTSDATPPVPKSGSRALFVGAGALLVMFGVGGAFLWMQTRTPAPPAPTVTPAAPPPTATSDAVEAKVTIKPKEAKVTVDGSPATVEDGVVKIKQRPGMVVSVVVEVEGRRAEKIVAITSNGVAVPAEIDLGEPADAASAKASHDTRPGPRTNNTTTVAPTVAPAPTAEAAPSSSSPRFKKTW